MTAIVSRAPKRAHIQASSWDPNRPLSLSCGAVAKALQKMGYKVELFTRTKPPARHKITPLTPVKGDTGMVKFLYERTFPGVTYPSFDIPNPLRTYARRKVVTTTLGALRGAPHATLKKFVKPVVPKLFPATSDIHHVQDLPLPDDTGVLLQDLRQFRDECRFFVAPWTGPIPMDDYLSDTDTRGRQDYERMAQLAQEMYEVWKPEAPKCFIMDVGMSAPYGGERYSPTLVEINSVLTAGNMDDVKVDTNYAGQMLATAWKSYARYGLRGEF